MQLARRPARVTDELQPIRDAVCLDAYNDLISISSIATVCGKSRQTIWRWIKRAKANQRPPNLAIWANDSGSFCRHRKPIVPGMPVLCIECWQTGIPDHRSLQQGDPIGGVKTTEHQPKGTPAFTPHARKRKNRSPI